MTGRPARALANALEHDTGELPRRAEDPEAHSRLVEELGERSELVRAVIELVEIEQRARLEPFSDGRKDEDGRRVEVRIDVDDKALVVGPSISR
jgi:hypothetical protein